LFEVPKADRGGDWQKQLLSVIGDASMAAPPEQTLQGPDGHRYFVLLVPDPGATIEPFCVSHVMDFCLERGMGVVFNPFREDGPDWIVTFGDLWTLRQTGSLMPPPEAFSVPAGGSTEKIDRGFYGHIGAPSDDFLPSFARSALRSYLKNWNIFRDREPKVAAIVDNSAKPDRNLTFNIFPQDFPDQRSFEEAMHDLRWFLPKDRGLISLSGSVDPTVEKLEAL
jgi:hypothetical protein